MQQVNELQKTQLTDPIIKFLDNINVRLKANGNEVRTAIIVLNKELQEKQNAAR